MDGDRLWPEWSAAEGAHWIATPGVSDDKYSRGVLGVITGSDAYPGAAVLGTEAAMRTGVGMVRYLGSARPSGLVLSRRPEIVTARGRVQAWLVGSGMDPSQRDEQTAKALTDALGQGLPTVIDAGALDLVGTAKGPVLITPHYRELAGVLGSVGTTVTPDAVAADPGRWALTAAEVLGVVVLVKGNTTWVAAPDGDRLKVSGSTPWLATAGTGDVLAGILGALLATHAAAIAERGSAALVRLAATGSLCHSLAAERASAGGPISALDVAEAMPATLAELLRRT